MFAQHAPERHLRPSHVKSLDKSTRKRPTSPNLTNLKAAGRPVTGASPRGPVARSRRGDLMTLCHCTPCTHQRGQVGGSTMLAGLGGNWKCVVDGVGQGTAALERCWKRLLRPHLSLPVTKCVSSGDVLVSSPEVASETALSHAARRSASRSVRRARIAGAELTRRGAVQRVRCCWGFPSAVPDMLWEPKSLKPKRAEVNQAVPTGDVRSTTA